jgi:hypothetical protein
MCVPMAVAAAIMVAGTMAQMAGQQQANDAINNAESESVAKQSALRDEANGLFQNSVKQAGSDTVKADAQTQADKRMTALVPGIEGGGAWTPEDDAGTSRATKRAMSASADKATGDLTREASGRAVLGGTNQAFQDLGVNMQPNADRIGNIGNFVQGTAGVLPMQIGAAQTKGSGLRSIGGLVAGLGSSMMGASAGAGGGGGASA